MSGSLAWTGASTPGGPCDRVIEYLDMSKILIGVPFEPGTSDSPIVHMVAIEAAESALCGFNVAEHEWAMEKGGPACEVCDYLEDYIDFQKDGAWPVDSQWPQPEPG